MREILDTLRQLPDYQALLRVAARPRARVILAETPYSALSLLVAAIREDLQVPVLFVVPNLRDAEIELRRVHAFLGAATSVTTGQTGLFLLPSFTRSLHESTGLDPQIVADRLRVLSALASDETIVVVGTPEGVLQRTIPTEVLTRNQRRIRAHQEIEREELLDCLIRFSYRRTPAVEVPGEFSVRGGILDLFPATSSFPVRLEFYGDEVESVREFDPGDQRSRRELSEVVFGLANETDSLIAGESAAEGNAAVVRPPTTILDHLPSDAVVLLSDPLRLAAEYATFHSELQEGGDEEPEIRNAALPLPPDLKWNALTSSSQRIISLGQALDATPSHRYSTLSLRGSALQSYANQLDLLVNDMKPHLAAGGRVFFASKHGSRLKEMLAERELGGRWEVFDSPIQEGFSLADGGLVFLTDREVFGWERVLRPLSAFQGTSSRPLFSVFDLRPADLVVHINHGIGHFGGVVPKTVREITNDYILINYAGGDRLFVPVTHLWRVQKYVGGEAAQPTIHRLRSSAWGTTKSRAKRYVEQLAKELLNMHARRQVSPGFAFSADSPWMGQLEASFAYEETESQVEAIRQVKTDMELPKPMERLVCGEVGFGKTEVAVRAAFKAVLDGKQVAVLAPTTILAQQHFATFSERLAPQGVALHLLSRFQSPKEQKSILDALCRGAADIVIGTHRLLQRDVRFKDLGLLVVDEEQRFGVRQKERLKKLKETVDVLTLTATPIPRTLQMALSGMKDMTLINDAPVGRLAVKTHVVEETDGLMRDAILRELERGGQVYFVHNRIESINHALHRLSGLLPSVRIRLAHGQMPEDELEPVIADFLKHEFDVLLCTTIIENGLDIPNANTLIVRDADRLGLAQMYQLRGRVGRSNRQAYAYFLYRRPHRLSRVSLDRLQAIREMSELGAGFRLALRDLEIRGAGNLLGEEQHGHIEALGFELYSQLLEDAVRQQRGERLPPQRGLPSLDLPLDIRLPHYYIPEETDRLQFYRRFAGTRDSGELEALVQEMTDRFGPPPESASNLVEVVRLRSLCLAKGVAKVTVSDGLAVLEADSSAYPGQRGRVRLHIRSKDGRMILDGLRAALSSFPDVE